LMPGNVPVLQSLQDIIAAHSETSQKAAAPPPPEKVTAPQTQPKAEIKPAPQAAVRDETPAAAVKTSRPASEDEAGVQLRRILSYYYEVIENNETIERIPEAFFTFGIARQLQWSTMPLPSAEEKITSIDPPNDIIRKLIKDWFNESKIDVLIPRIELEFIKDNSEFRYWLDAQKYLVLSLEKKGGNYLIAASDIKYHLARLIKRLPDLQSLKFSGGEIPFAEKDTIKWLDEIGRSSQTSEKPAESGTVSLAPIVDATYGEINAEYDQAIKNLPKGFEDSFKQMQQKLSSEERPKGKFLRRLNIGNLCYEAKQYSVAKVNLEELKVTIDEMNLAEWEPALSASVWQALYLTNVQLLFTTENDNVRSGIEKEQEELFNKIAKYNGILAINLEQQKHKRRK
ncbi:MAG TPA: type VI secretion system domain-containing protein, partial [Ignavibacteriaceae bacterium]